MLLKVMFILAVVFFTGFLIWLFHAGMVLPIRRGNCGTISVTITAFGEAPELEMQLRGLLWLRSNGILPCVISVNDAGLTAEASAALRCFAADRGISVSDERGKQIHGREKRSDGDQREHSIDHLSE